jgi:hypothetical protein
MKNVIVAIAVALICWSTVPRAQNAPAVAPAQRAAAQGLPALAQADTSAPRASGPEQPPADNGLNDLASMTFGCPKAALNAAAREAAAVRSKGTYQFTYFRILSNSHHSTYEVRFKSNFAGEKELKYCVALYCQQGWDPRTTKASVTLMGNARQGAATDHGAHCAAPAEAR